MKQQILPALTFLILSCFTLNAQIPKKSILLGGSLGYNSSNYTSFASGSNANISPRISYAIGNNSVIGLWGNFSHGKNKSANSDDKITNTSYEVAAFWRRYFPVQNRLGWYTELSGGIGGGNERRKIFGGDQKSSFRNYTVAAVPGVFFQALPRLVLNANIGGIQYYHSKSKGTGATITDKYSSFNVNFLSSFNFGVDFILGKKTQG